MTNDFNGFLGKNESVLQQKETERKVISCHFEIKITIEKNLEVAVLCRLQLNNTNIRTTAASFFFLTYFVLLFVKM